MKLTAKKQALAIRAFRNGRSVGYVANLLRVSFVDALTIRRDMPAPKSKPSKKLNSMQCYSVRRMRDAGFKIEGLMKHYGLTRDEVMQALRATSAR